MQCFGPLGLALEVQSVGFRAQGLGFEVQGLGFRVHGLGVRGTDFRI